MVERLLVAADRTIDVSFCPERIAEGHALEELHTLPQIISARTERAAKRADQLFSVIAPSLIRLEPEEAEVAKLFTNTWRYIKFAAANQMFMIANDFGLDFARIRAALEAGLPARGRHARAGPRRRTVSVEGHDAARRVQQQQLHARAREHDDQRGPADVHRRSARARVRPLVDDRRDPGDVVQGGVGRHPRQLELQAEAPLRFRAARVLCTDPYVEGDIELWPLEDVLAESDLLVIATPHAAYATLDVNTPVVDVWNLLGNGERV